MKRWMLTAALVGALLVAAPAAWCQVNLPLPQAQPEQVGVSKEKLDRIHDGAEPGDRRRQDCRHGCARRPQGQAHLCRRCRLPGQGRKQADGARFHLPHLFDDQADRLGRRHAAGRGRQDRAHRPGLEIPARVQGPAGQRGARRQRIRPRDLCDGPGRPRDDRAGSIAAHRRPRLRRDHRQCSGQGGLCEGGTVPARRSRLRRARPHAGGGGRAPGQGAARASARHGVGVQHGGRSARPRGRGGFGQAPVGFPRRAAVQAAEDAGHRVLGADGEDGTPRPAACGRRRQRPAEQADRRCRRSRTTIPAARAGCRPRATTCASRRCCSTADSSTARA